MVAKVSSGRSHDSSLHCGPQNVRSTGERWSHGVGKLLAGGADLTSLSPPQIPLAIFGVIGLLAALLVTFMPETSTTPLPDTLKVIKEDAGLDDICV